MDQALPDAPTAIAETDALWYEVHVLNSVDALCTLARCYQQQLYAVLSLQGFQQSDSDDILSEVWLALWNTRKNFQKHRSFKPWLYGQLRFKVLDFIRKNRIPLVRQHFALEQVPDESTPEVTFENWLFENAIVDITDKSEIVVLDIRGVRIELSMDETYLLFLHDVIGLDRTEIGCEIHKKPQTVTAALCRLHNRLRTVLEMQHADK